MRPRIHAAARRRDRRQILLGACCMKTAPNVPNKGARAGPSARLLRMREARPSVSSQFIPLAKRAAARAAWETCPTRPLSSPRRHRHRGAQASPPLIQPPAGYRPPDLNFSTLDTLDATHYTCIAKGAVKKLGSGNVLH